MFFGTTSRTERALRDYTILGLLFSLALHLTFLITFYRPVSFKLPEAIEVNYVENVPERDRQIVSLPEEIKPVEEAPDNAFQSDKNTVTEREQIRRGDGPDAGPAPGKQAEAAVAAPAANSKPEEKSIAQKAPLKDLKLDQATLLKKFSMQPQQEQSKLTEDKPYSPFTRPLGSGAAFLGVPGSNDFLPQLPDGDLTLLNTKANLFAVFVRRVATQVFAQLRTVGWEELQALDIRRISDHSTVRAILSPQGEVLKVELLTRSGSDHFDQVLMQAARRGSVDFNPPKGAVASDGNIHFIFQSRSWVQLHTDPRGGAREQRWIMLGTGLE